MLGAVSRTPSRTEWLIWISAKNWSTGAVETAGFWTGPIDRTFTVEGQSRVYVASGHVLSLEPISYVDGVNNIQSQTVDLNGISANVRAAILGYNTKQAPIEIHRLKTEIHNPATVISIESAFYGHVDEVSFARNAAGESDAPSWTCTLSLMSAARRGTRTLQLKKSNESHKLAFPTDNGRKYSSSKAKVTWMGEVSDPHRRGISWRAGGGVSGGSGGAVTVKTSGSGGGDR